MTKRVEVKVSKVWLLVFLVVAGLAYWTWSRGTRIRELEANLGDVTRLKALLETKEKIVSGDFSETELEVCLYPNETVTAYSPEDDPSGVDRLGRPLLKNRTCAVKDFAKYPVDSVLVVEGSPYVWWPTDTGPATSDFDVDLYMGDYDKRRWRGKPKKRYVIVFTVKKGAYGKDTDSR